MYVFDLPAFWSSFNMSNGKGSTRRKMSVSKEKYYENWKKIFNQNKTKTKTKKNNRED